MNSTLKKAIGKIAGVALVASQLAIAAPALAVSSPLDSISATMSAGLGLHVHTPAAADVDWAFDSTLTGDLSDASTITFDDQHTGTSMDFSAATLTSTGTCVLNGASFAGAVGSFTVDVDNGGPCSAADTIVFALEGVNNNSATVGSHPFYITSDGADDVDTSYFAVAISTEDQITVTAAVDPFITFDLDAAAAVCTSGSDPVVGDHTPNTNTYTVALGTIAPSAIKSSENSGGIFHICTTVSTNAAEGYSLSVRSTNGGLYNGSQYINSTGAEGADATTAEETLSPGSEGYGLCLSTSTGPDMDTTVPVGSNLTADPDFDGNATCDDTSAVVGSLSTTTEVIGSNGGPVQDGTAQWNVKAAIAATTGAGAYTDTLTFVATGTF